MADVFGPPTSLFNSYKAGQKSLGIPIPSITGGAAGPSGAGTAPTYFGGVNIGGGLGFSGYMAVSIVAIAAMVIFLRRK